MPPFLALALVVLALAQVGCPIRWQRVTINEAITPENVEFIETGITQMATIVAQLGSPDEIVDSPAGVVFRYRFMDTKYFKVIPTWGLRFLIPALSLVPNDLYSLELSTGGMGTDEFQVVFDPEWRASAFAFASHARASRFVPARPRRHVE